MQEIEIKKNNQIENIKKQEENKTNILKTKLENDLNVHEERRKEQMAKKLVKA